MKGKVYINEQIKLDMKQIWGEYLFYTRQQNANCLVTNF